MLATWTEVLPLFVIRWLARRHCERVMIGGNRTTYCVARPDVLVQENDK